jgi:hypothetical protein
VNLGLAPELETKLDDIVEHMKADPILGSLQADLGREKAIRYAIVRCWEALPRSGAPG